MNAHARFRVAICAVAAAPLLGSACASESEQHPYGDSRYGRSTSALTIPSGVPFLDFDVNHGGSADLALTFDDGPDGEGRTDAVLDILKSKGVQATFFINTNNAIDVNSSSAARNTLSRIIAEGHELVNHTVHHYDFNSTSTNVESELAGVETVLRAVTPTALAKRMVRAPYGNPYFGPQARLDYVAPIVAQHGVHIGWDIDSLDWTCSTSTCVRDNVLGEVDAGKHGVVLMHSPNQLTGLALPGLIDALRARGKQFVPVEQFIVAKYGKPSRQLIHCQTSADCYGGDICGPDKRCGGGSGEPPPPPPPTSGTTLVCTSISVTSGSLSGTASTRCSSLANDDSAYVTWNKRTGTPKTSAHAIYSTSIASVAAMYVDVVYRGDDSTEPLWYWSIQDATTGSWIALGDNSWAGDWVDSAHTFTVSEPARVIDSAGEIRVRFTTSTSKNLAQLDKMVVRVVPATGGSDAGVDSGVDTSVADSGADTSVADSGADTSVADTAVVDSAAPTTDTVSCSAFTALSGSFYGSASSACSGTMSLATKNNVVIGWAASATSTKPSAYLTYTVPAGTSALKLAVSYRGDDATEPAWYWHARNTSTGAWDLIGDNSWAGNWVMTDHTFDVPTSYIAGGRVDIRFTTTSSTNDAELDRMVLLATH